MTKRGWLVGVCLVLVGATACVAPDVPGNLYYDGTSYVPVGGTEEPTCVADLASVDVTWPATDGQIGSLSEPSYPESTMSWTSEVLADGPGPPAFMTARATEEPTPILVVQHDACFYAFQPDG